MEEQRGTKEEVKEGTKDGTSQEATQGQREEVKEVSFLTVSATATNAAVKGTLLKTAGQALTRSTKAQGGQQE